MKLRSKLMLISLIITTVMLGLYLFTFYSINSGTMRDTDEDNARKALKLYCMNIMSVVNADASQIQEITLRSTVDYYFASYARLLQGRGTYYSLSQDGEYLFNTCPFDPMSIYDEEDIVLLYDNSDDLDGITILRAHTDDGSMLFGACSFYVSGQIFDAYISIDVSDTEKRIFDLQSVSLLLMVAACFCVAALTYIFMLRILRPITKLTDSASYIASGKYDRRTGCRTGDEIGRLSIAFDSMADSIEDKIRTLDEQLKQDQFLLGALTHELKTPMTSIIGYSDSLLHMPLNDEQRTECAMKIYEAGKRTEALAQKIMELVGMTENGNISKKKFSTYRFIDSLKSVSDARVRFSYDIPVIYGDETLLFSMVMNLIDNAVKASKKDGTVNVMICDGNGTYRIIVADKGSGIPNEYIDHVKRPFFRVDKARSRKEGGAGIGLALCEMIVKKHGGTMKIESDVGIGTEITITLSQLDDNSDTF